MKKRIILTSLVAFFALVALVVAAVFVAALPVAFVIVLILSALVFCGAMGYLVDILIRTKKENMKDTKE